ncbi:MAG TPA: hypothetical protein VGK97_02985 [Spongiibacteraceae bacterium]|jgi:hypothetical protein
MILFNTRKSLRQLLVCIALGLAAGAHAELKGSYQLNQGKQKLDLYYLDDNHMRANLADKQQLVLKGSESWLLHRQGEQWLAVDAEQASALLKATHGNELNREVGPVQLRDTGRKESVAGYAGKVYELTVGDNTSEVVLTDNPDVLALTNGWRTLALKLSKGLNSDQAAQLQQALSKIPQRGMGGLLRQGNALTLVAIDKNVSARDTDFPANTQVLPKLQIPGL